MSAGRGGTKPARVKQEQLIIYVITAGVLIAYSYPTQCVLLHASVCKSTHCALYHFTGTVKF